MVKKQTSAILILSLLMLIETAAAMGRARPTSRTPSSIKTSMNNSMNNVDDMMSDPGFRQKWSNYQNLVDQDQQSIDLATSQVDSSLF